MTASPAVWAGHTLYLSGLSGVGSGEGVRAVGLGEQVHEMARNHVAVHILPDRAALYDAIADVMVEAIAAKRGEKVTMILPVGPVGQYPAFARKVQERGLDCRNLWTFNMDEFLDRNGRTIPETHPMSFKGEMMRNFYELLPAGQRMPLSQMFFPRHDNMDDIDGALDEHAGRALTCVWRGSAPRGISPSTNAETAERT